MIAGETEDGEPRRRRRRGGRGRGRGRGRPDDVQEGAPDEAPQAPQVARAPLSPVPDEADEDEEVVPARRAPKATPFGSVWDSQLGTPTAPAATSLTPLPDDEDFDEPEIPEYLIAEQQRGANRGGGGARGARGGRSAYQSAMDRERYGGGGRGGAGGGAGPRGGGSGGRGINRYPDVSNRPRPVGPGPAREDRGYGRPDRAAAPAPRNSSEPWSDVPPELEALLRAQVAQKPAPVRTVRVPEDGGSSEDLLGSGVAEGTADAVAEPAGRGRTSSPTGRTCPADRGGVRADRDDRGGCRRGRRSRTRGRAQASPGPTSQGGADGSGRGQRDRGSHGRSASDEGGDCQAKGRGEATDHAEGKLGKRGVGRDRGWCRCRCPGWRRRAGRAEATDRTEGVDRRTRLTQVKGARTRGQAAALDAIAAMVRGRAPHAILLSGPEGVGKTTLALDLAAGLLCEAEPSERPCRECRACRMVERDGHPDLHRLGPAGPGRQVVIGGPDAKYRGIRDLIVGARPASGGRPFAGGDRGRRGSDERGRPVRAAQDARGAACRGRDRVVRGSGASPPADRSIALRPDPARSRWVPRYRGDRGRPRPCRSTRWRPDWAGWRLGDPGSRLPTHAPRKRS